MNGISALKKGPQRALSPSFHHVRIQEVGRGPSPELDQAGTLILDFQPPEL